MPTPRQLIAQAEKNERKAEALIAEARAFRAAAGQLQSIRDQLTPRRKRVPIESMESTGIVPGKRKLGPLITSTGPVARVAKSLGVSIGEVARRLGQKDRTVRTWDARKRIPDDVKPKFEALEAEAAAADRARASANVAAK